jgi:hypothetical protein
MDADQLPPDSTKNAPRRSMERLVRDLSPEQVADYEKQWRDATARLERWIPWEHKTPSAHQIIADEFARQQRMEALLGYIPNVEL